ncbi:MAG TPA: hypothetical protein VIS07_08920 [Candidatus Binatia bacterium]
MPGRSWFAAASLAAMVALVTSAQPALGQDAGSTLSPDFRSYLVNKDLGPERWTINLNLYARSVRAITNITGNIFRSDGGPASFVTCFVRADSTGSLEDPESVFRLSCSGGDACTTTAEECARTGWTLIDDDVRVPASFFLPPDGNGSAAGGVHSDEADAFLDDLIARLSAALAEARRFAVTRGAQLARPRSAWAQANPRGATLSADRMNYLVSKDVGSERWAISYSLEPVILSEGGLGRRFLSVTGNVYQADGSPPAFVYCTEREDSTGTLSDPTSIMRFSCQGASACATTAAECAQTGWTLINDDVALQASFFLPPEGLPAAPQSDPEILVIGRTSDPPSIASSEFVLEGENGTESSGQGATARPAGACPEDAVCFVPQLGSCENVQGRVVDVEDFGCACLVEEVPTSCIGCTSASEQCGTECDYPVGDATARGICMPFNAFVDECVCYAIGAGEELPTQGCGGPMQLPCSGDRCCVNDPRGSCLTLGGEVSCPGVCVAADGCDTETQQCGFCMAPPGAPTPTPTPDETPTPTPEPSPTPTATPTPTTTAATPTPDGTPSPTPSASPTPTPTPIPICLPAGAQCDPGAEPFCCGNLVCLQEAGIGFICVAGSLP